MARQRPHRATAAARSGNKPPTVAKHPCPYSTQVIDALREILPGFVGRGRSVHDPFAGEGVRLGGLCDGLRLVFTGTDLESWCDGDPRVEVGNARDPATYPSWPFVVVTSPTYNNGVNDHFEPRDESTRMTYRVAAGHALDDDNTGRWSGRGSKTAEAMYWEITEACVANWPSRVIVNVKDSYRDKMIYPFVDMWDELLRRHGYRPAHRLVEVPGHRHGTNHEARVPTETLLVATR